MNILLILAIFLFTINPVSSKVINFDTGGEMESSIQKWRNLELSGERVIINGPCLSSCTLALRLKNVCVTDKALFGFHRSRPGPTSHLYPKELVDQALRNYDIELRKAVPKELNLHLTKNLQYVRGSQMPTRYRCK